LNQLEDEVVGPEPAYRKDELPGCLARLSSSDTHFYEAIDH